jgi:hypothetical protein
MGIGFQLIKSWRYDNKFQKPSIIMNKKDILDVFNKKCNVLHGKMFYVNADGTVDPCCYRLPAFQKITHFSLEDYNIKEIIEDNHFKLMTLFIGKNRYCRIYCNHV